MNTLGVLRVGDRVVFAGEEHTVVALAGTSVRLVAVSGQHSVVLLPYLLSAGDFAVIGARSPEDSVPLGLLDGVPDEVAELCFHACWLHHATNEHRSGRRSGSRPFFGIIQRLALHPCHFNAWMGS